MAFKTCLTDNLPFPTRSRDRDFVDEFLGMESTREFRVPVRARRNAQKERFLCNVNERLLTTVGSLPHQRAGRSSDVGSIWYCGLQAKRMRRPWLGPKHGPKTDASSPRVPLRPSPRRRGLRPRATSVLARTRTFRSVRDHRTVDPGVAGLNPVGLAQEAQPFGLAFCLLRQTMATDVANLAALGAPSAVNRRYHLAHSQEGS